MKRKIYCFLVVTVICVLITVTAFAEMGVYTISDECINGFFEQPSLDFLNANMSEYCTYEKEGEEFKLERPGRVTYHPQGWFAAVGGMPMYHTFYDFATNTNGLADELLKKENISFVNLNSVIEIASRSIPVVIWINTNNGGRFITVYNSVIYGNPCQCDNTCLHYNEYVFVLYTRDEFVEKYSYKPGDLFIDEHPPFYGSAIIGYKEVFLPLRLLMESNGAGVEWNDYDRTVYICIDNEQYIFDTNSRGLYKKDNSNMLLPPPGSSGYYRFKIIDDRIYVNENVASELLELCDRTMNIDYDERKIVITPNDDSNVAVD